MVDEVVSLTIWCCPEEDIEFFREDRLVADDENPDSKYRLAELLGIRKFENIVFYSSAVLHTGKKVVGKFTC